MVLKLKKAHCATQLNRFGSKFEWFLWALCKKPHPMDNATKTIRLHKNPKSSCGVGLENSKKKLAKKLE